MAQTSLESLAGRVDLGTVEATALVVDDDEDLADTYALWLADALDVHTAYSGEEALDTLEDENVDVVLLDRRMPSMSGDELLLELDERGHDPRVSIVTAAEPGLDIVDLPFEQYLVKPVGHDTLLSTVEELLALDERDEPFREYFALKSKLDALEAGPEYGDGDLPEALLDLRKRTATQRERAFESLDDDHFIGQLGDGENTFEDVR